MNENIMIYEFTLFQLLFSSQEEQGKVAMPSLRRRGSGEDREVAPLSPLSPLSPLMGKE